MKHGAILAQYVRFGVTGAALTALVSLIYVALVSVPEVQPGWALTVGTVIATVCGFFAHSAFSFRAYGTRDQMSFRFGRFIVTNSVGYVLNFIWVYVLVDVLEFDAWTPIIAFFLITPPVTFGLNRMWVFK